MHNSNKEKLLKAKSNIVGALPDWYKQQNWQLGSMELSAVLSQCVTLQPGQLLHQEADSLQMKAQQAVLGLLDEPILLFQDA